MRSFALAEAWRDAGSAVTFAGVYEPATLAMLARAGFDTVEPSAVHPDPADARALADRVRAAAGAVWTVIDGYHLDAAYQTSVRNAGSRTIVLDDEDVRGRYDADIVLNQNLHGLQLPYSGASGAIVLAGPQYALVRREFRDGAPRRARRSAVRRVLILSGGADPAGISALALDALRHLPDRGFDVTLVAGPSNRDVARLQTAGAALGIDVRVAPPDVAALMAAADLAVAASGSTVWELAYLGVPAIYLSAAANQAPLGAAIAERGAGVYLGEAACVAAQDLATAIASLARDETRRAAISHAGLDVVDGEGPARVRRIARALDGAGDEPDIRPVRQSDSRALWRLANEPDVRANSFSSAPIPFESHEAWLAARLAANDERFWAADVDGAMLGHVRYARAGDDVAEAHFTIARPARGRGLASRLLARTAAQAARELGVGRLTGVAFEANAGSHRAFEKAGYHRAGAEMIKGRACVRFERKA